jgi:hypothetical protein
MPIAGFAAGSGALSDVCGWVAAAVLVAFLIVPHILGDTLNALLTLKAGKSSSICGHECWYTNVTKVRFRL